MTKNNEAQRQLAANRRGSVLIAATSSKGGLTIAACGGANQAETAEAASDGIKTALSREPGKGKLQHRLRRQLVRQQ